MGGKRGWGAPGQTPFIAAISRNEKGHPIHIRFSRIGSLPLMKSVVGQLSICKVKVLSLPMD